MSGLTLLGSLVETMPLAPVGGGGGDDLVTEDGDSLVTEGGDHLVWE